MPRLVCRFIYVDYHMLASYCEFAITPVYMPISVPVYACSVTNLTCQLQYTCIYMSAHECQISVVRCQVSLYANLGCYMSNCYLLVNMPSPLFQELYAKYYGLYAKLHMLDCNMPNAMTVAMSFKMTTEQGFSLYLKVSGLRYFSLLAHQVIKWYLESQVFQYANISWHEQSFSMPAYHGMSKVSVCRHIRKE
jgi:hypothetical protein